MYPYVKLSGSEVQVLHQDNEPTFYPETEQYLSRYHLQGVGDKELGTYECIASNKVDSSSAQMQLSRSIRAPFILFSFLLTSVELARQLFALQHPFAFHRCARAGDQCAREKRVDDQCRTRVAAWLGRRRRAPLRVPSRVRGARRRPPRTTFLLAPDPLAAAAPRLVALREAQQPRRLPAKRHPLLALSRTTVEIEIHSHTHSLRVHTKCIRKV